MSQAGDVSENSGGTKDDVSPPEGLGNRLVPENQTIDLRAGSTVVETESTGKPADSGNVEESRHVVLRALDSFDSGQRSLLQWAMIGLLAVLALDWVWIATRRPDPLLLNRGDGFQQQFRVDINSATWVEWLQLDGIGPSLAHRIVADRKINGPFRTIDEVQRVPGIGPTKLDRIRRWLTIGHAPDEAPAAGSGGTKAERPDSASQPQQPTAI